MGRFWEKRRKTRQAESRIKRAEYELTKEDRKKEVTRKQEEAQLIRAERRAKKKLREEQHPVRTRAVKRTGAVLGQVAREGFKATQSGTRYIQKEVKRKGRKARTTAQQTHRHMARRPISESSTMSQLIAEESSMTPDRDFFGEKKERDFFGNKKNQRYY